MKKIIIVLLSTISLTSVAKADHVPLNDFFFINSPSHLSRLLKDAAINSMPAECKDKERCFVESIALENSRFKINTPKINGRNADFLRADKWERHDGKPVDRNDLYRCIFSGTPARVQFDIDSGSVDTDFDLDISSKYIPKTMETDKSVVIACKNHNGTNINQDLQCISYSTTTQSSSTYSTTNSCTLGASYSANMKVDALVVSTGVSYTLSGELTSSNTESKTFTTSDTFTVPAQSILVPPHSTGMINVVFNKLKSKGIIINTRKMSHFSGAKMTFYCGYNQGSHDTLTMTVDIPIAKFMDLLNVIPKGKDNQEVTLDPDNNAINFMTYADADLDLDANLYTDYEIIDDDSGKLIKKTRLKTLVPTKTTQNIFGNTNVLYPNLGSSFKSCGDIFES